LADAVLDAGVAAMSQLEAGDAVRHYSPSRVGYKSGVTPAVLGLKKRQGGTGVGTFAPADDPGAGRPGRKVEHAGELGQVSAVSF